MSQPASSVLNGPSADNNMPVIDDHQLPEAVHATNNGLNQQYPSYVGLTRPPLTRLDSRSSLALRPGFPPQQIRPQQIRQPIPGQPFQRPPLRPPPQVQFNPRPLLNPNFRPSTPFPRPPPPRVPGLFQQRYPRPLLDSDIFPRSQTLDPHQEASHEQLEPQKMEEKKPVDLAYEVEKRPSIESLTDKKGELSRPESRASTKTPNLDDEPVIKPVEAHKVDFILPPEEHKPIDLHNEQDTTVKPHDTFNGFSFKSELKELDLKHITRVKSPSYAEGDNDSGVDESTQGNDQSSNGDRTSPRKPSGKIPLRTSSTTPTKNRSLSRGSKSPSLKSPDSAASTPGATEKKKLPMNKVQVGSAPSPNLKVVRSKIGSLDNSTYRPGGGNVKIENKKLDFKNMSSRIEAKNDAYTPKGGDKKIPQQKLQWTAKSKIGSLDNTAHKPKGGDKKIESVKLDFKEKAKSKVGSKDNIKHVPGGGEVKIESKKIEVKAESKVGSMDNMKHRPGGGEKKIFDDKEYLKQMSAISSEHHSLTSSQNASKSIEINFNDSIEAIDEKIRILESVRNEIALKSRPSSTLRRSNSERAKKNATPRPPWKF